MPWKEQTSPCATAVARPLPARSRTCLEHEVERCLGYTPELRKACRGHDVANPPDEALARHEEQMAVLQACDINALATGEERVAPCRS